MSNIPGAQPLFRYERGMQLTADTLNVNFALLYGMIESVAAMCRQRDPQEALGEALAVRERLAAIEQRLASEERRQNTAFNASVTAVAQQMHETADLVFAALDQLWGADDTHEGREREIASRVAALEIRPVPPPAPRIEDVVQLNEAVTRSRSAADIALRRGIEMASELRDLRKILLDPDRGQAARAYAPLAMLTELHAMLQELLRRISALEQRR